MEPKPSEMWSAVDKNYTHRPSAPGWSVSATLVASFPLPFWVKKNQSIMFSDAADVSKLSSRRRLPCYLNQAFYGVSEMQKEMSKLGLNWLRKFWI